MSIIYGPIRPLAMIGHVRLPSKTAQIYLVMFEGAKAQLAGKAGIDCFQFYSSQVGMTVLAVDGVQCSTRVQHW